MNRISKISTALAFLLAAGAGCQRISPKLAAGIMDGQRLYAQGNFGSADRVLSSVIAKYPRTPQTAEAYYIRGLTRLKQRKFTHAQLDFSRAVELAKRDDLKTNAMVCLGSIAYEKRQWARAYDCYRKASDQLPGLSPTDWILYRLGDAAQKTGHWDQARKYFARLTREFPNSKPAQLAKRRFNCQFFTVQVGVFSKTENADARLKTLERADLPVWTHPRYSNGNALQAVCVGKYNDFSQASRSLARVKQIVPEAYIVP